MTLPHRPIPDEDPTSFSEPGHHPGVPKEPGPAPTRKDREREEEREAKRDVNADLLEDHTPLNPRGGGSTGAGS